MDLNLKDKIVIITGGGSGIGEATSKLFAKEGAKVIIADINEERAEKVAREIGNLAFPIKVDISKIDEIEYMVNNIIDNFGKIDILINNAGIYRKGDILSITEDEFHELINVNVKGVLFCTKYVAKEMKKQKKGVIINIASEAGIVGIKNQVIYNLTKSAVISITKSCAIDLAPYGIRVNCISPGTTLTPLVEEAIKNEKDPESILRMVESNRPLNRLGKPEEIAFAIVFLASDLAGYATGANLSIDGGYTIW
jgi:NAD(P)-dependent dehydrogenase (short-subunit alcohol dehydrogenase family)